MIMKKITILFFFIGFLGQIPLFSQTDKEFWFAAPKMTISHNGGQIDSIWMVFTTKTLPATITIEMPVELAFVPITFTLPANTAYKLSLNAQRPLICKQYGNYEGVLGKNNNGIHIKSSSLITCYYENGNSNNCDIFALKGRNSLGSEFYTSFQTTYYNMTDDAWTEQATNGFIVVATEDNTQVTINSPIAIYGHPAGLPFTINLDRGEVYQAVPEITTVPPNGSKTPDWSGRAGVDHTGGAYVTTNGKAVAITLFDDSMKSIVDGCYDLAGDQTIPTTIIGTEYIAMRGQLSRSGAAVKVRSEYQTAGMNQYDTIQERIYILGTSNGDSVFINGVFYSKINKSQTIVYKIPNSIPFVHIRTKQKSYVYQITGFGCEMGGAILPPTNKCTGSLDVGFSRSSTDGFFLNIMVRRGGEAGFLLNGVATALIPAAAFSTVPGDTNWSVARLGPFNTVQIPLNTAQLLSNSIDIFHLGVINGGKSTGTRFGYFSDYNEFKLTAFNTSTGTRNYRGCKGDALQLVINGGNDITWSPAKYLSDPYSATPEAKPMETMRYVVSAGYWCDIHDSTSITVEISNPVEANFTVSKVIACAPVKIDFFEYSQSAKLRYWDFGFGEDTVWTAPDSITLNKTFIRTYNNTGTTAIHNNIRLIVLNKDEMCPDTIMRSVTIYPQINAGLSLVDSVGCQPFSVVLTNTSTGNTKDYDWQFGDGGGTNAFSPSNTYFNFGNIDTTYRARLIATSHFYCRDTVYKKIIVHPYIDVKFMVDTVIMCAPTTITFKNQSYGVDNFILNLGDGTIVNPASSFTSIKHTYVNTGIKPDTLWVKLIGTNNEGCSDTMSQKIIVYPTTIASFISSQHTGCDSLNIAYTNLSSGYNLEHNWNFGDNTFSNAINPTHLYTNKTNDSINRTITLIVIANSFCRDTLKDTITIYPFIKADFTIDAAYGCTPFNGRITNSSIGVDNFAWYFGDGITSNTSATQIPHIYYNATYTGNLVYDIRLIASNKFGCTDSIKRSITVYPSIKADFNVDTTASCDPAIFNFTNASLGAASYLWTFGDVATSSSATIQHTYPRNNLSSVKKYNVNLKVVSSNNACSDNKQITLKVYPFVKSEFSKAAYGGCHPFKNTFYNSSIGDSNIYTWSIDGVNQNTSEYYTKNPLNYTFNNASGSASVKYIIGLKAFTKAGSCIANFYDTIEVYPNVVANVTESDNKGCHPHDVMFTNTSVNATKSYWEFGDKATSTTTSPSHTYKNFSPRDSIFIYKLIASSNNCADTISDSITVYTKPKATFEVNTFSGCAPLAVSFDRSAAVGSYFYYRFGDGYVDSTGTAILTHNYINVTGVNKLTLVSLVTKGSTRECSDSATRQLTVFSEVNAAFSTPVIASCSPFNVSFTNKSKYATVYNWNFGDGITSTEFQPNKAFTNSKQDNDSFLVILKVNSSYGCMNDTSIFIKVYPSPNAAFSVVPELQYFPNTTVTLNLDMMGNNPNWNYLWDFNDGNTSNVRLAGTHVYTTWGKYRIKLKIDNTVCIDTTSRLTVIEPPIPIPSFTVTEDGCVPLETQFTNTSQYFTSSKWEFDDGSTSTETNPKHTFIEDGFYDVKLTVSGDGGNKSVYHRVEAYRLPIVKFSVDAKTDTVFLPDAKIICYNKSQYAEKYLWEFGDGSTSDDKNPYHVYGPPPEMWYTIRLSAWSDHDCLAQDSIVNGVYVQGAGFLKYPNVFFPSTSGSSGGDVRNLDPQDNSVFRPFTDGVVEYQLQIFNRWGELIYKGDDINFGWDGYYKENLVQQGVYIYRVTGKYSTGDAFIKMGDVTLIIR